jgi:hypothetical protein
MKIKMAEIILTVPNFSFKIKTPYKEASKILHSRSAATVATLVKVNAYTAG